ncbi:hypothetical protein CDAR_579351 [Caerostris darwini]|uniref:Transposase n=1 Tax=Caerostris darwini TaxID=1538125 RepID=A0AAV4V2C4_9ARAC|nr:hypothetical protein CDAR_579351 [Caerostris darwini]
MQRFACEKRIDSSIGKRFHGLYTHPLLQKWKRKARVELSAFRIDGKKQGNRFGIDLDPNSMAIFALKNDFRPENGLSAKSLRK